MPRCRRVPKVRGARCRSEMQVRGPSVGQGAGARPMGERDRRMSDDTRDRVEKPSDEVRPRSRALADEADAETALEGEDRGRLDHRQLKAIIEALVFASPEPLTPKMLFKLLADEPKEDLTAAIDALEDRLRRSWRAAPRRSGRRLSDHHPSRISRVGAAPVPRTIDTEAVGPVARDAVGDRL